MKKRLFCGVMLLCLLSFVLPVMAIENSGVDCFITDDAGILTLEEWAALESEAESIAAQFGCGLYVVILDDYSEYGYSPEDACDTMYESYGAGRATNGDCIIMLLSMADRDYYIEDYGDYGLYVLTVTGRLAMEASMLDDFRQDDWYNGLRDYLRQGKTLLEYAATEGNPYGEDEVSFQENLTFSYGVAFVIALIAALITCLIFWSQMNTAVKATNAHEYLISDKITIRTRTERYTHSTRSVRKIESSSSSGGGRKSGGGGKF